MAMGKRKESFLEDIKKAFAAFSYEHSGEMLSSHSKNKVLSGGSKDKSAKDISSGNLSTGDNNSSSVLNETIGSKLASTTYDRLKQKAKSLAE